MRAGFACRPFTHDSSVAPIDITQTNAPIIDLVAVALVRIDVATADFLLASHNVRTNSRKEGLPIRF
jgi:hypothetical protein